MNAPQKAKALTFTFKLSEKIKYSYDGSFNYSDELVLHSPSRNDLKISRKIEQIITSAMMELSLKMPTSKIQAIENDQDSAKAIIKGSEILAALYCQSAPIDIFYHHFQKLMCTQCCCLNDQVPMTSLLYETLDPNDEKRLAGEYCAFFLTPSFLNPTN